MSATRLDSVLHYVRRVLGAEAEHGSDADLLARFVRHRDETAFELLMWRHAAMVLRVCQAILRDSHAAEDAFQATFLALARKASSISHRESVAAWLYQVAYRVALKARLDAVDRRALEVRQRERRPVAASASAGDDATQRDLLPLVHEELNRLSAKYRSPLVLCYLEGKTHAEAAAQLGWAKGTVSGRLARAREMLKKRLVRRGVLFPAGLLAVAFAATKASAVPSGLVSSTIQAALAFAASGTAAAGVSAPVLYLTQGVLHAMFLSKVKCTTAAVIACLMIFGGVGALIQIGLREVSAQSAAPYDSRYYAQQRQPAGQTPNPFDPYAGPIAPGGPPPGAAPGFGGPSYPSPAGGAGTPSGRDAPGGPARDNRAELQRRLDSRNNLKQLALGFHSYHDANGAFPTDIVDEAGQPLLSWRVAILPYIEHGALYEQFRLDEPWNSAHNKKLLAKMPQLYRFPGFEDASNGPARAALATTTCYQGFVGKGTAFEPNRARLRVTDFTDGLSQTILLVEIASAVEWTKPEDIRYSAKKPIPTLGVFDDVIHAAFADGAVHGLRPDFDEKEMRKAITRNDGEELDMDKLKAPEKNAPQPGRPGFPGMPPAGGGPGSGMPPGTGPRMPGAATGGPGMPGSRGPMPGTGPSVPGSSRPGLGGPPGGVPADLDITRLRDENAKLEQLLQQTADEMQLLRNQMEKLRDEYATRQLQQKEAQKLLAERDRLRQAVEAATAELQTMRQELQQLKRALDKEP